MASLPTVNMFTPLMLSYQEHEAVEKGQPLPIASTSLMLSYQEHEAVEKGKLIVEKPDVLKVSYIPLNLKFEGKVLSFDGTKFQEEPSIGPRVFVGVASEKGKAYAVGGLKPDGTASQTVEVYGDKQYVVTFDRDALVFVCGEGEIVVYNEEGNRITKIAGAGALLVKAGFKLVSARSFEVRYVEL